MVEHLRKALVYLDGSDSSYTASQYAVYLAKKYQINLMGVCVVKDAALEELMHHKILLPQEKDEYLQDLQKDAEKHERQFRRLAQEKEVPVQTLLLSNQQDTKKLITDLISKENIDYFIIGELPHFRSRTDAFYSEAEHLIRMAPCCCVLIVKDHFRVEKLFDSV